MWCGMSDIRCVMSDMWCGRSDMRRGRSGRSDIRYGQSDMRCWETSSCYYVIVVKLYMLRNSSFAKYVDLTGGDSKQGSRECDINVWASYG